MKLLTKDHEIVEGEVITDGLAKLVEDVNEGIAGLSLYPHQRKELIKYMVANFELTLKAKPVQKVPENSGIEVIFPSAVAPVEYPEPSKSLPLVETADEMNF